MGEHEPHVGTHGAHVGWMVFQKKIWTTCLMGLNKKKFPIIFNLFNTKFRYVSMSWSYSIFVTFF
jgi:hypothetical protein